MRYGPKYMLSEGKNIHVAKTLRRSHYMMTDTPSHFAWSESSGGKPIGGSPGASSPNGKEIERAKSADNAKVRGWGTPTSDEHFSSWARQISPKFSGSLGEGGSRRGAKKFRNLTREFRENRGQSTPRSKISTPHISPKWGAIPPKQNLFFTRVPRPTIRDGQLGGGDPLRG